MTTELTIVEPGGFLALNQSTDEIRDIVAANLGGQEVGEFDLTRLTVPAGGGTAWEVETLTGTESVREVSGIIVYKKQTRAFWPVALGESESGPPVCSSPDAVVGYGKQWATPENPDPDGDAKRMPCADCPLSKFGTGRNGGQACQEKGQWFMLQAEGFLPIVVTLPAMSLGPAKKYLLNLAGAGLRYDQVVTKLTLEKASSGKNTYSKVIPTLGAKLDPEEAARARAYSDLLAPIFDRVAAEQAEAPVAEAA
jgi:hypothetical protein